MQLRGSSCWISTVAVAQPGATTCPIDFSSATNWTIFHGVMLWATACLFSYPSVDPAMCPVWDAQLTTSTGLDLLFIINRNAGEKWMLVCILVLIKHGDCHPSYVYYFSGFSCFWSGQKRQSLALIKCTEWIPVGSMNRKLFEERILKSRKPFPQQSIKKVKQEVNKKRKLVTQMCKFNLYWS